MKLDKLIKLGALLAPQTYARTRDRSEAHDALVRWARTPGAARADPGLVEWLSRAVGHVQRAMWAALWASSGYPQVVVGHKLAASLMATRLPVEAFEAIEPPWPAYAVLVPNGLVPVFDETRRRDAFVDLLLVERQPGNVVTLAEVSESGFYVGRNASSLRLEGAPDLEDDWEGWSDFAPNASAVRATDVLWRLMLGVELELSDPSRFRAPPRRKETERTGVSQPPSPSTYTLTRSVAVDCRDAIVEHVLGQRRSLPSMNVLVRGHWKWQPHGPEGSLRKWTHIEPYWRFTDIAGAGSS